MKKFLLLGALLSMTVSAVCADQTVNEPVMKSSSVMKALPIYSNTLIDKAPAGEVVTGIRNCYSSMMKGGDSYRDFEYGVLGEYVLGDDGCIYLRKACYKAGIDTYLKLDKVDEGTYVAHTPQLIWVDDLSDGGIFTAYATRVVFSQKSATSFGYEMQQMPGGDYDTDIYFTLEDGKLSQKNQATTEMNGEIFPEELIGFTTSTGGWIGFGDGCLEIAQSTEGATRIPDNIEVIDKSLDFNVLHVRDIPIDNAVLIKYAEDGENLYLSNPSSATEQWIKGTFDSQRTTVTFLPQYLGMDYETGFAVWFIPAKYDKYIDYFDVEDPDFGGDWFRTYEPTDKLVFTLSDGILAAPEGFAMFFSHDSSRLLETGIYAQPSITGYDSNGSAPASVTFTKYEPYDDMWGFGVIGFGIPAMDVNGVYIPTDELFYNVYPDDCKEPFVFSSKDYVDMEVGPMTDIPYNYYEDFDFKVNGVNHTCYFYHDWKKVGVQVVRKHNGTEYRSEIVYSDGSPSDVEYLNSDALAPKTMKKFRNGEMIIVCGDEEFNAQGIRINNIR